MGIRRKSVKKRTKSVKTVFKNVYRDIVIINPDTFLIKGVSNGE